MPVVGHDKNVLNFLSERIKNQIEFWPEFVEKWDEEAKGKRFKSEALSLTELWNLYLGYVREVALEDDDAVISRIKAKHEAVKKPKKGYAVIPIRTFELPGRFNERSAHHEGKNGYLHFDQWLYARDQARKDLFWFGKEVFDMDFFEHVHRVTTNQFVQKDFDGAWTEGYTNKNFQSAMARQNRVPRVWIETAEYEPKTLGEFGKYIADPIEAEKQINYAVIMILLDPRGFFKTFTNILDTVQWIINCPDIRILIMSGTYKLTKQFLSLAKGKFFLPPGRKPTKFHLLFPEYVDRSADGDSDQPFEYPGRYLESPDPTLGIMSLGSNLSGFHCDILKFDDIVTDENSNTEDTREALKDKANGAMNLLMPWGWHDVIGTRYFPDDYYGRTLDKFNESPEDFNLKFFARAAWTVKPEHKHIEELSLYDLTEDMVTLTFPEHVSWKKLRSLLRESEKSFRCQQLNQPVWGDASTVKFDRALLETARDKTLSEVESRKGTDVYTYGAIDLAKENKQFSDYTAIAICKIYQDGKIPFDPLTESFDNYLHRQSVGKWIMVVLDCQFGKWSQSEIANRIAEMNNRWRPLQWAGEDTGGLESFKEKIVNVSLERFGNWPNIRWMPPQNSENAKRNRIKGLEQLLRSGRLFFLIDSKWNNDVFEELEKYKGQKSTRYFKDDVPDVLAQLTERIPRYVHLSKQEIEMQEKAKEDQYRKQIRLEIYKATFGDSQGGFGMSQNFSYEESVPEEPRTKGPVSDIGKRYFRGNGMRA
jgi:predicted phage terminase large subunit-like protein